MTQRKILSVNLNKLMADNKKKDKTPPKNKKETKKQEQTPPSPTPPVALDQPDPLVMKVIRDALLINITNTDPQLRRRQTVNELDAMVGTCQEFLQSFVILGYNFDGQPIPPIVIAHNQQEADALGSYLSKFIQSTITEQGLEGR